MKGAIRQDIENETNLSHICACVYVVYVMYHSLASSYWCQIFFFFLWFSDTIMEARYDNGKNSGSEVTLWPRRAASSVSHGSSDNTGYFTGCLKV